MHGVRGWGEVTERQGKTYRERQAETDRDREGVKRGMECVKLVIKSDYHHKVVHSAVFDALRLFLVSRVEKRKLDRFIMKRPILTTEPTND